MKTPNQNPTPQPTAPTDEPRNGKGRRHHHHDSCHGSSREERPERRVRERRRNPGKRDFSPRAFDSREFARHGFDSREFARHGFDSREFALRAFAPRAFAPRAFAPRDFGRRAPGPRDFSARDSDRYDASGPRGSNSRGFDRRDFAPRGAAHRNINCRDSDRRDSDHRDFTNRDFDFGPDRTPGPCAFGPGPGRHTRANFAGPTFTPSRRTRGKSGPRAFNRRDFDPNTTHHGPSTPPAPHNTDSHTTCDHRHDRHRDDPRAQPREERRAAHHDKRRTESRDQRRTTHRDHRAEAHTHHHTELREQHRPARHEARTARSTRGGNTRRLTPDQRADLRATQIALTAADRALRKLTTAYAAAVSTTDPTHRDQARTILTNARRALHAIHTPEA